MNTLDKLRADIADDEDMCCDLEDRYQHLLSDAETLAERCDAYETRIAELEADIAKYKPFHDAMMEYAVVNWTYEASDETDYIRCLHKLIAQAIAYAADPVISAQAAAREEKIRELETELARVKAKSLRIVKDGEALKSEDAHAAHNFAICNGVVCSTEYAFYGWVQIDGLISDVRSDDIVQPVRLVKWEGE
jgi:hypothetical protein